MNLRLFLSTAGLLLLAVSTVPMAAQAAAVPLPGGVTVGDRDGDGLPEVHAAAGTPPCLCYCPVVGAGVDVEAAGQEVYAIGVDGLCAYAAVADVDPGAVTPLAPIVVTPIVYCNSVACQVSVASVSAQQLPQVFHCWETQFDAQGDGNRETWQECSTPECGCMCPVVGAGVVVEAAPVDKQVGVVAATSGCQTAYATTNGPADGSGKLPVAVWPIASGGAILDPIVVTSAAQIPTGCTGTGVGDHDGDGVPEASGSCTGPMCGCNCPVVGAGVELIALGQDVGGTALAGCGYYLAYDANPGDVDWDGPTSVTPRVYCYGGGLFSGCSITTA